MKHRDELLWTFPRVVIVALLLFCTINTAPTQTTLPAEDIAEKALAATVYLEMKDKKWQNFRHRQRVLCQTQPNCYQLPRD